MKKFACMKSAIFVVFLSVMLTGQSTLERYGTGLKQPSIDVSGRGIGGISTMPVDGAEALFSMPASWYRSQLSRFNVTLGHNRADIGDETGFSRTGMQGFNFIAHTDNKTAFGLGLAPFTRVNIEAVDSVTFLFQATSDTLVYVEKQTTIGGLSTFNVGMSKKLNDKISYGISAGFIFGTVTSRDTVIFSEKGGWNELISNLPAERRSEYSGKLLDLSILWDRPFERPAEFGIQVTYPINLKAISNTARPGIFTETTNKYKDLPLPGKIGAGLRYDLGKGQHVLVELEYQGAKQTTGGEAIWGDIIKSSNALRMGWAKYPDLEKILNPGRFYYRVGISRQTYHLTSSKGNPLTATSATIGFGIRNRNYGNRIDLSLEMGFMNEVSNIMANEEYVRLSLGLTAGELWFARQKKEWD